MTNSTTKLPILIMCLLGVLALPALLMAADGGWLKRVPDAARVRKNPLADHTDAPVAGEKLFRYECAGCHGTDARGRGSRPSLRSSRVQNATDGELEWLLTNGDLAHGMPSWSRLPEGKRWQIVRYLHTLPAESCCLTPGRLHG
jgi:mono/diheme cytochrome c family protein